MTGVTPSMNGRIECKKDMPLSVRMSVDPALVVMAAAPITTHNNGVMSSGFTSKKIR
jgi:3-polyprenyl-4-hydroxybenzoate decarboxylase